jgi:hypothetical protein
MPSFGFDADVCPVDLEPCAVAEVDTPFCEEETVALAVPVDNAILDVVDEAMEASPIADRKSGYLRTARR